jgi:hypothetical protein
MKFALGLVVATPGALDALKESCEEPGPYLLRHNGVDWGELDDHDRSENQVSLQHGFRLLSRIHAAQWHENLDHHRG